MQHASGLSASPLFNHAAEARRQILCHSGALQRRLAWLPEFALFASATQAIDKTVAARNAATRRGAQQTEEEASRLDAISTALRERYVSLKAETGRVRREKAGALRAIEQRRRASVKLARQVAAREGLWWPNYNTVLARADVAYARAVKKGAELRIASGGAATDGQANEISASR